MGIDFVNEESAKSAINMNGKKIKGRTVYVDYEHAKPKKGFHMKMELDGNTKYNKDVVKKLVKKPISKAHRPDHRRERLHDKKSDGGQTGYADKKSELF